MPRTVTIIVRIKEHIRAWFSHVVAVALLVFLFFVTGGGISQHESFKITQVDVIGNSTIDREDIVDVIKEKLQGNYYFVYARDNSSLFPRREIEAGLVEKFPRIQNVVVHKMDAHTIVAQVTERKPFALWCGKDADGRGLDTKRRRGDTGRERFLLADCWFLDETGFIFDRAPTFSEGVYLEIYGPLESASGILKGVEPLRARVQESRFVRVYPFERTLNRDVGKTLRVIMKPEGQYGIIVAVSTKYPMLTGAEIRFKDSDNSAELLKNLLAAIPTQFPPSAAPFRKLYYVDLRFGNKVVFGFE
ncbi:MAG: hypothetical protein UY07_C0021G0003 [Parcubacteria group bacterium GW2011_GWA1_47_8]|nr:MAG: hypothetical protein UY07_C0021G0003 [Parcubacteria group bacterium GW2011_GWA1_47_8]KKW08061.1 MAG: hypothetical protein UY42_C0001G0024 [Parcubacteria group bacterium GW2011_GWA2_49_16]